MPTVSEIQDYLKKHQKPDEPIADKAKERVTRQLAEGVKQNQPLPSGRCNGCGREDDRLAPAVMRVCPACVRRMMERGGKLEVYNKEVVDTNCDNCLSRTFTPMKINPMLCNICTAKLGRMHKYDGPEMKKERQRINQDKKERYQNG